MLLALEGNDPAGPWEDWLLRASAGELPATLRVPGHDDEDGGHLDEEDPMMLLLRPEQPLSTLVDVRAVGGAIEGDGAIGDVLDGDPLLDTLEEDDEEEYSIHHDDEEEEHDNSDESDDTSSDAESHREARPV